MPLWGLFQIADVAKQNSRERKLRELLIQKGFPEAFIKFAVWAIGYVWADDKLKRKIQEKVGMSKEELEARINRAYILMLQHEDIANVLVDNKKKAIQAHKEAVALLQHTDENN